MDERIEEALSQVKPIDNELLSAARSLQLRLTKPPGSLGRLEEIGNRLAAIRGTLKPRIARKRIYVVAADHGVATEGVSAYPQEVTRQMVLNFLRGGAAVNVFARHVGAEVRIVDAGVNYDFPQDDSLIVKKTLWATRNMARGPAMSRTDAAAAVVSGIELAREAALSGVDLLGIGEMGIGNTTAASAITSVLGSRPVPEVTGRGTGIDRESLAHKVTVIERAIKVNTPDPNDPIDVLSKVGGAEIGVMAGLAVGAAAQCIPLVADGFISTAAAALAVRLCPRMSDYLFIAHLSEEPGHRSLIGLLEQYPILDLGLRLGEGTGAALAMSIIEAAAKIMSEMATFESAGVSDRKG
ncbi:MAG: nicotinate-nucleotide--dimethylbenzimidazole phosphoribosyltransferase [Blastocatellia bacterium]